MLSNYRFARAASAALALSVLIGGAGTAAAAKKPDPLASAEIATPVMAVVSLASQRVTLYDAHGGMTRGRVSSGQTGYETPVGVYSVLEKQEEHYSNLYDDASMPYMQRITWSGIALHAGVLPGYPASHGCVRMPNGFAERIFGMTRIGMRVVVAHDDVAPVAISNPLLFKPKPVSDDVAIATPTAYRPAEGASDSPLLPDVQAWPAREKQLEGLKTVAAEKATLAEAASAKAAPFKATLKQKTADRNKIVKKVRVAEVAKRGAEAKVARADKWLATAKKPRDIKGAEEAKAKAAVAVTAAATQLAAANVELQGAADALAQATEQANTAEAARVAAVGAAADARARMMPPSVFISLKKQRLYLRQGFEPVLDVPVAISDPDTPIGTHIFTALGYGDDGNEVRWNVVSLARHGDRSDDEEYDDGSRRQKVRHEAAPSTDLSAAVAALERVSIPPEVLTRVSEFVWPGSSLIISDEDVSKETGKATDFVVLLSGYPQGGIKKRPKLPPINDPYYDSYYGYDSYRYNRPSRPMGGKFLWW